LGEGEVREDKFPHRQEIHEELMEVWEYLELYIINKGFVSFAHILSILYATNFIKL